MLDFASIDRLLNDSTRLQNVAQPTQAAYGPFEAVDTGSNSITFLIEIVSVIIGGVVVALVLSSIIKCIVRRRHRMWLRSLPSDSISPLKTRQAARKSREDEINRMTTSLFRSGDHIPLLVRYFIPVIILGNIPLFLSGHLSLGAAINIEAEFAGKRFTVDKFFEFSMARSTFDIWRAGGKAPAILMILFSGVWPYTKQIMTLALWFTHPKRSSSHDGAPSSCGSTFSENGPWWISLS